MNIFCCRNAECDGCVGKLPPVKVCVSIFEADVIAFPCNECGTLYFDGKILCDQDNNPAVMEGASCIIRSKNGKPVFISTILNAEECKQTTVRTTGAEAIEAISSGL